MAISYAAAVLLVFGQELQIGQSRAGRPGARCYPLRAPSYAIRPAERVRQRLGSRWLVGLATSVACLLCIAQYLVLPVGTVLEVAPQVIWLASASTPMPHRGVVLAVMMAIERIGAAGGARTGMIGLMSTILMRVVILGRALHRLDRRHGAGDAGTSSATRAAVERGCIHLNC